MCAGCSVSIMFATLLALLRKSNMKNTPASAIRA